MNGTIQKKKDSRSDFQRLLFVFECSVVIISSHLFNRKDSHTTKTDLHCYGILNTGNSESCLCSSIVYTLQFNTWRQSLLELLYNVECISGHKVTTVTKVVFRPSLVRKLTGGNWQKWKRVFLTCSFHKIYRDEAVGLKSCKYSWKITEFVKMGNLGQYRENLIFCQ